ncbi:TetR family transcriptional regulator C-terminal domain-containing protein [Pseudooceanicola nitratireducens]|jgi:TetR/AcrR family transcriptional regulator|uniref:TetR family transcriptional regulator C-terminal domain-containing protein n=1 Tax=Pseudooceanicola nitratireducens TaxID=517719 RepID=UPI001C964374|nr:TetR family transcriptional regulator C-terminal domain-containing protein [Pseudooceanicola nitratireducens]MBY6165700.1 TetR family transcriptional regulator C-terminal domain-containing protein [Pseudooceanicola nitratireducens]MEC7792809.1 TetR family transcriptional regulator C-terminal domain-containing protein [Pseudomonadota bacterium]|eukprot:g19105.t1
MTGVKDNTGGQTRIQRDKIAQISEAALDVFSTHGFRGATVDQIAKAASLSKPNLLYYFPSKEAIHTHLLENLLDTWLDPLRQINPDGDPLDEILTYVRRKLTMSRDMPRESRLFAYEIIQGAPNMGAGLEEVLKPLVDGQAQVIRGWMEDGRLRPADPHHLIFSIWSLTQHYADFDVQVRTVLGPEVTDPFPQAEEYLVTLFTRMLAP